jgi:hypothetical protein
MSADPIGILIVVGDEVPSTRFYIVDALGHRLSISPQTGPVDPVNELDLRQDHAQMDRGNTWLTSIAVRFSEPGCYYGVFDGSALGVRRVQIRIDP